MHLHGGCVGTGPTLDGMYTLRSLSLSRSLAQYLYLSLSRSRALSLSLSLSVSLTCRRGTARAEDAQGTPAHGDIPPSILVYEDKNAPNEDLMGARNTFPLRALKCADSSLD